MKKTLLLSTALLLGASAMTAAVPEGNLYLTGVNGQNAPADNNLFVLGERDDDDIDEGIWRWTIENFEVTEGTGTFTVTGSDGFTLGYDADNGFFQNNLTTTQNMLYLAPGGPAVNYDLQGGEYTVILSVFEDIYGDMGGDSWMIMFKPNFALEEDESFYLLGFNGTEDASAASRFVKKVEEEDGETVVTYTLPRYRIDSCEAGFTVLDAAGDATYGFSDLFGSDYAEVTDETPMSFLAVGGEPVKCSLTPGYYDVNFAPAGAMNIISFLKCENQTSNDALEYYLVGLDGSSALAEGNRFTRSVEVMEYEDEDTGETVSEESVVYSLTAEVTGACELTVVSAGEEVAYGYNSDMSAFLPNDLSDTMPFTMLVTNGEPVKCSLTEGTYTFKFMIAEGGTASLSALAEDDGAVEGVEIDSDSAPEYYNLQGQRVMNPGKGIYIEKRGTKTSKVVL